MYYRFLFSVVIVFSFCAVMGEHREDIYMHLLSIQFLSGNCILRSCHTLLSNRIHLSCCFCRKSMDGSCNSKYYVVYIFRRLIIRNKRSGLPFSKCSATYRLKDGINQMTHNKNIEFIVYSRNNLGVCKMIS